jgi:DNA-binding NarL/FixJ family response regulator
VDREPGMGAVHIHEECAWRLAHSLLDRLEAFHPEPMAEESEAIVDLSPREMEVLEGIVSGERDREIADRLGITEHTVKNHAYDIRRKLGVRSRTEAAVQAVRAGLMAESRAVLQGER